MSSPYTLAADALALIIDNEFRAERISTIHDRLHEAVGQRKRECGIYPRQDIPMPTNKLVQETWLEIRFFDRWTPKVDPWQSVDPRVVADYAERLREAIRNARVTISGQLWYFDVEDVTYPPDPTGNITRFFMQVRARGNNAAIVETA